MQEHEASCSGCNKSKNDSLANRHADSKLAYQQQTGNHAPTRLLSISNRQTTNTRPPDPAASQAQHRTVRHSNQPASHPQRKRLSNTRPHSAPPDSTLERRKKNSTLYPPRPASSALSPPLSTLRHHPSHPHLHLSKQHPRTRIHMP
jgi:hypothetical protein